MTVCHLFPSISPHGDEVPTSIWNLRFGVWRGVIAPAADAYLAAMKKGAGRG